MEFAKTLERLHSIDRESQCLEKVLAVLQWDQETYMPPKAVEERAEQLALLEGMAHEKLTAAETGRLLEELGSTTENPQGDEGLPPLERDFCKVLRRKYDREVKLPTDFVSAAARAVGLSQAAWAEARKKSDFAAFVPHLKAMIDFARKKAEYWGYTGARSYDGLLDIYEPGATAAGVGALFTPLRERLSILLKKIAGRGGDDFPFLDKDYDAAAQERFSLSLMDSLGFDRNRGRLDVSAHPFTSSLGGDDIRITTRYLARNVLSSVFSTIHESGHAFYEMGLPAELQGTCLAGGASMAFHESQSRLWENVIGRSRAFWDCHYPLFKAAFPEQTSGVDAGFFYKAANRVRPSLIRVDADEVSYSLHIILRFELEQRLFSGSLEVEALPETWRQLMGSLIGVVPENDAQGVLQDIHWSMGSFGYFPSYALGNLYGLSLWRKLRRDLSSADNDIAGGKFGPIHAWLKENIYRWGCRLEPAELLKKITGEELSVDPFLEYIEAKYSEIYG